MLSREIGVCLRWDHPPRVVATLYACIKVTPLLRGLFDSHRFPLAKPLSHHSTRGSPFSSVVFSGEHLIYFPHLFTMDGFAKPLDDLSYANQSHFIITSSGGSLTIMVRNPTFDDFDQVAIVVRVINCETNQAHSSQVLPSACSHLQDLSTAAGDESEEKSQNTPLSDNNSRLPYALTWESPASLTHTQLLPLPSPCLPLPASTAVLNPLHFITPTSKL